MREELFTELHSVKMDVKCLQRVVMQNTARLVGLLKEHDEYVKKSKINPPGYNRFALSVVSDFAEVNNKLNGPLEKLNSVSGKSVIKMVTEEKLMEGSKPTVNGDGGRFQENSSLPTSTINGYSKTIASDLGWDSNDENDDEAPFAYSCPTRFHLDQEPPVTWEIDFNNDQSSATDSNLQVGAEFLCDISANDSVIQSETLVASENNVLEPSVCDPVLVIPNYKHLRCYVRKKVKSVVEPSDTCLKENVITNGEVRIATRKAEEEEKPFCVISEVVGNAKETFSEEENAQDNAIEASEGQVIMPKKTNDITKIKGWRRKQFFVEKPTTVEFFSYTDDPFTKSKKEIKIKEFEYDLWKDEEPGNVENAFVCDSLDEFLESEAELKINYEIPHLYAEVGIRLTSEDIASKPNLTAEDFKEVEKRYYIPLPPPPTDQLPCEIKGEDGKRGVKRRLDEIVEPSKLVKIDENRRRSVRIVQKQIERPKSLCAGGVMKFKKKQEEAYSEVVNKCDLNLSNLKFRNKLIGVVVYPGPFAPLHPLVQRHLGKLRSYRTRVDKNWANFAASAVCVQLQNNHFKRMILPVFCTGKLETNSPKSDILPEVREVVNDLVNSVCTGVSSPQLKVQEVVKKKQGKCEKEFNRRTSQRISLLKKSLKPEVKLKECRVVLNKISSIETFELWCLEHNCYNCSTCKRAKPKADDSKLPETFAKTKAVDDVKIHDSSALTVTPQTPSDTEITNLLTKKLRGGRFADDTPTSIDNLKTLTPNGIELIKLNFVKQSFLTGYVTIWYLKPETSQKKSRAFLTFSKTPPVPNAVNLKSCGFSLNILPKVITEIVSAENTFDSNDYAIFHCNGQLWEIHGSLNFAVEKNTTPEGKTDEGTEQIFTLVSLPELEKLQKIALTLLQVEFVKWWVLDLNQKFSEIQMEFKSGTEVVTRKNFLWYIKSGLFGFITLNKGHKDRVFGAYLTQKVLPFVLLGPYYILESNKLTLKLDSTTVPFMYQGEETLPQNSPLKSFINSVILGLKGSEKKLTGLWLYDKMRLDSTCYLEVMTTRFERSLTKMEYSIGIEHGYSLNSHGISPPGTSSGVVKRAPQEKLIVYLYFELVDLGYVKGELQKDNSVIINHPLAQGTRVKSPRVGDWFIGILKRRIYFIPKNLELRWYITKHREDLRDRQPFNKLYLGGAHIICKSGIFYMLKMTDSKIRELGLEKKEVHAAIAESRVINEVMELKNLEEVVLESPSANMSMEKVLRMAVNEIQHLADLDDSLLSTKIRESSRKLELTLSYLTLLDSCPISDSSKFSIFEKKKDIFLTDKETEDGFSAKVSERLQKCRFYQNYLQQTQREGMEVVSGETNSSFEEEIDVISIESCTAEQKKKEHISKPTKVSQSSGKSIIEKLEAKLYNVYDMLEYTDSPPDSQAYQQLIKKLNSISDQLEYIKSIFGGNTEASPSSSSLPKRKPRGKKKFKKPIPIKSSGKEIVKEKGFQKLSSSRLPKNRKVRPGRKKKRRKVLPSPKADVPSKQSFVLRRAKSQKAKELSPVGSSELLEAKKFRPKILISNKILKGKPETPSFLPEIKF